MNLIGQAVTHKILGEGVITNQTESTITVLFGSGSKRFLFPDSFNKFIFILDKAVNAKVMAAIDQQDNTQSNKTEPYIPLTTVRRDGITYPPKVSELNLAKILNVEYKTSISSKKIMALFTSEYDALILSHFFRVFTNQRIYEIDLIIMEHLPPLGGDNHVYLSSLTFTHMRKSLAKKTITYNNLSIPSLFLYADLLSDILENISTKSTNTAEEMRSNGKFAYLFKAPFTLFAQSSSHTYQYGETSHFSIVGVLYN